LLAFDGHRGDDNSVYDAQTHQPIPNVVRKEGTGGGLNVEIGPDGKVTGITTGGGGSGKTTDAQQRAGYAGELMTAPMKIILDAFDNKDGRSLPDAADYQKQNVINYALDQGGLVGPAIAPFVNRTRPAGASRHRDGLVRGLAP